MIADAELADLGARRKLCHFKLAAGSRADPELTTCIGPYRKDGQGAELRAGTDVELRDCHVLPFTGSGVVKIAKCSNGTYFSIFLSK
ncbi:hypothetical protein J2S89_001963 [Arthrobacter bambusae]|nr:hypothetical protein [Arthrobacter bambusae]MDQ0030138.1 hypothetical protein [Arthrobacter bambusae]MDQ0097821.1 hypothetical protein [Arthrobacter bambusae]